MSLEIGTFDGPFFRHVHYVRWLMINRWKHCVTASMCCPPNRVLVRAPPYHGL